MYDNYKMIKKQIKILNNSVQNNEPILIKNFLKNYDLKEIDKFINNQEMMNYPVFNILNYINLEKINFVNNFVKEIQENENYELNKSIKEIRIWMHDKGHKTKSHYDGNGIYVINLCLNGRKKFILSKPNSQITIPFINLTLFDTAIDKREFIVEKYDLFLIPSYWFHEVIALQDNTITININFINKNEKIDNHNLTKFKLHKFFNTPFTEEKIFNFIDTQKINPINFLFEYIKESFILILVITIIILIEKKFKIELMSKLMISLGSLTLFFGKKTLGMLNIFFYNFLIQYHALNFMIK
jgi:hypothetical protein